MRVGGLKSIYHQNTCLQYTDTALVSSKAKHKKVAIFNYQVHQKSSLAIPNPTVMIETKKPPAVDIWYPMDIHSITPLHWRERKEANPISVLPYWSSRFSTYKSNG